MSLHQTRFGLKPLFILSVILNLFLATIFLFLIHSKGGVSYVKEKVHEIFSNSSIGAKERPDTPPGKSYIYNLLSSLYEKLPSSENDIIFIGDSHIEYGLWSELFQNPNVKNRGIAGDTTEGVLSRIGYTIKGHPAKVFIMAGINDIGNYDAELDKIVRNYKNIINVIKNNSTQTRIYILSVLPVDATKPWILLENKRVFSLNNRLKSFNNNSDIFFVDLYSLLTDENDNLDMKYSYDGLHLNSKGYFVIKNVLEDYIN